MAYLGFRHLGLKCISVALAALLWLVVSGEQIVERALRVPLEFTNLPQQLEMVGEPPNVADVRIRGSSGALSRVSPGELVAVLDLRSARRGRRLFHLAGSDVRVPFGIEVVQIAPSNVAIAFEESATKMLPVVPNVEGDPADGFVVGTVRADPATVEIVGPATAVAGLTEAITEAVSVTNATEAVTESVTIGVPDSTVRLRNPQSAKVTVNVTESPVEWAIAAIQVQIRNAGGGRQVSISPTQVTVHVRGPREARGSGADTFEATADVEGLGPGQFQVPVRVTPPGRIGLVSVEPSEVRVRIK